MEITDVFLQLELRPTSENEIHDAIFGSPHTARAFLGRNLVRIQASSEACVDFVSRGHPRRFADLGGGCGLTCFAAASEHRNCEFIIVDRCRNALTIGESWARDLQLSNVHFIQTDFCDETARSQLPKDFDLVSVDYLFDLYIPEEASRETTAEILPAVKTARMILDPKGTAYVRFGGATSEGLRALVAATSLAALRFEDIQNRPTGTTITVSPAETVLGMEEEYERLELGLATDY